MIGVSQVKSLVHAINKDFKSARRTQKIFYEEMVEPKLDNTPGIGHTKAMIHLIAGNSKRGVEVLKDSTRSAAIIAAGGLGEILNF